MSISISKGLRAGLLLLVFLWGQPAWAQWFRQLPAEARRGEMTPPQPGGAVSIDGLRYNLSPGALIRGQDGMIVPPPMLTETVRVKYLLDSMGLVHRVWILSADEIARPDPEPVPPVFTR